MDSFKKISAFDLLTQGLGLLFVAFAIITVYPHTYDAVSVGVYQNNISASVSKNLINQNNFYNKEQTFTKPIKITWQGRVFANLAGGQAYGIMADGNFPFYACCGTENNSWLDGKVLIIGNLTGITCAYKNTVFGQCVPEVEIDKIEKIK